MNHLKFLLILVISYLFTSCGKEKRGPEKDPSLTPATVDLSTPFRHGPVYTVYRFKAIILYSSGSKWMAQPVSDTWHDTIAIHNWVSEVIKVGDTIRVQADEFPLWSDPAKMVWEYAEDVQNNRSQACDCSEHDDI